jgi:hypothetical protein
MNKETFYDLLWRLEEILMHADHLRRQIGNCGGQCDGYDGIDDQGLCRTCCDALEKVMAEDEKLGKSKELDEVLKMLKRACDEDKTGDYKRILNHSREGKVVH